MTASAWVVSSSPRATSNTTSYMGVRGCCWAIVVAGARRARIRKRAERTRRISGNPPDGHTDLSTRAGEIGYGDAESGPGSDHHIDSLAVSRRVKFDGLEKEPVLPFLDPHIEVGVGHRTAEGGEDADHRVVVRADDREFLGPGVRRVGGIDPLEDDLSRREAAKTNVNH